jgi:hypothetical protein
MISQASQSRDHFAQTRWSVVMQFGKDESPAARDALVELSQRYWYPAYAYLRCSGRDPRQAQAMTGDLLRRLVEDERVPRTHPGHYRQFLLAELCSYVAADRSPGDDTPKPGPQAPAITELETRYQRENAGIADPQEAFQRSFALVVLRRALGRLREEAAQTGHLEMYRALQPWLAREPGPAEVEALGPKLQLRTVTVILALKRLRQRLRELAADELADTVGSADDLASEQEALLAILGELTSS